MKKILRSPMGKTVLFLTVMVTAILVVVNTLSVFVMSEMDFYTSTRESLYEKIVVDQSGAKGYLWDVIDNEKKPIILDLSKQNFVMEIIDSSGKTMVKTEGIDAISKNEWKNPVYTHRYYVGIDEASGGYNIIDNPEKGFDEYDLTVVLKDQMVRIDAVYVLCMFTDFFYPLKTAIIPITVGIVLLMVFAFVELMCVSGRKAEDEELHPGPLNGIPFDVMAAGFLACTALYTIIFLQISGDLLMFGFMIIGGIVLLSMFIGLCMSMAVRIKQGSLFKNSLIIKVLKVCWYIITIPFKWMAVVLDNMPILWKTLLVIIVVCMVEAPIILWNHAEGVWIIERLVLIPLAVIVLLNMDRLEKGGKALASGNLDYVIDEKKMLGSFRNHAVNLNNIAHGMSVAVDEKMKSERMKTELITNVSHDIKTPLTSVINYASLISKEKTGNKKITEYSEVLLRQSERLKRLIDDLVEASKASTGNLEVNMERCDPAVFITQADGEYEEKMKDAKLTLITKVTDEKTAIMADPRRMWRIFDNLMNNICKYSQPDTRVYISLETDSKDAIMTFKNTSKESLNISADELMERFVRGDSSRNTEGSGLGLSIAKSLAELQGGSLDLTVDGDLFKATLRFPKA